MEKQACHGNCPEMRIIIATLFDFYKLTRESLQPEERYQYLKEILASSRADRALHDKFGIDMHRGGHFGDFDMAEGALL